MAAPSPHAARLQLLAAEAAELLAERPEEARRISQTLLALAPGDPRGLLILASARRRCGDPAGALELLQPLAARFPEAAQTRFELGVCLAATGALREAERVLQEAAGLRGAPHETWRALGRVRQDLGDHRGGDRAFQEVRALELKDPELRAAARLMHSGDLGGAEGRVRDRLSRPPADPVGFELLGEVLLKAGRPADAELALREHARLSPGQGGFLLASALFQQQKAAAALEVLDQALAADPGDVALLNLKAAALALLGDFQAAADLYRELLDRRPANPRLWANYGRTLRSLGRRTEAVAAYRRSLAIDPGLGEAWWSLSNLKDQVFSDEDVDAMRRALEAPEAETEDRVQLNYALGKALEDRGAAGEAFAAYEAGARLRRAALSYDREDTRQFVEASRRLLSRDFFARREGFGSADDAPIFIVGLPRSGSTLLEQILASHPQVEGTMELPGVRFAVRELEARTGRIYPGALGAIARGDALRLAAAYLDHARQYRRTDRPFFIDKAPNNFLHLGLIRLMLPNARIIDARRHPMGACFSAFKQHFGPAQTFSYDLEDLGSYYRDYLSLMAHFDDVLPGWVRRVIYEDVVGDLESEVRRVLAALGLPFDARCLAFHETRRNVSTVSSEQVRRPIYREALNQWRAYDPYLVPLKRALGGALVDWRGETRRSSEAWGS